MTAIFEQETSITAKNVAEDLSKKLAGAGLRVTAPRLALAQLLFGKGNRHVSAEALYEEARGAGLTVSQATVYNTLNQFEAVGLLRQVQVDQARSYFDTNIDTHHHFYVEAEARLIDIAANAVDVSKLPNSPDGYDIERVEVIIRLDKSDA
ncbi:MAG: transcriptional repressor [Alphaproteobacteria bacterium]|nr:transcriptional repressor [Alphaproteobacteria bacterium]